MFVLYPLACRITRLRFRSVLSVARGIDAAVNRPALSPRVRLRGGRGGLSCLSLVLGAVRPHRTRLGQPASVRPFSPVRPTRSRPELSVEDVAMFVMRLGAARRRTDVGRGAARN